MSVKKDKLKDLTIKELQELKTISETRIIRTPLAPYSATNAKEYKEWRDFNELLQCIVNELEARVIDEYFE